MVSMVQDLLLLLTVVVLTIAYINFLWKRKKLYWHSWTVPGPFALPVIGSAYLVLGYSDDTMEKINQLMAKYPSPMKLWAGPRLMYCLTDPVHVEKVLMSRKCSAKGDLYRFLSYAIGHGLLTAPVPLWKKHRKAIIPSFNQKVLDSFVDIFAEHATDLTKKLEGYVGNNKIDMKQPFLTCTLNSICETALGLKIDIHEDNDTFAKDVETLMEIATLRLFTVWYHADWIWKLHPLSKKFDKTLTAFHKITSNVLQKTLKKMEHKKNSLFATIPEGPEKPAAFLDPILENFEFTEQELLDELELFLLAGADSTSITLCFLFEMLGLFPEIQQKVYEEVIDAVGEERLVEAADLSNLQYLERVIKETLRLYPVVAYFVRTIGEDIDLGQYTLPEGSSALFSPLSLHKNPEYWPDPLKFDPDRFLPEEVAKRHPCTFMSFSFGPRNCICTKYTMMKLKTIAATTIRKYRMFTSYKSVEEIELKIKISIRPTHGYKFYLEHR